MNLSFKHIQINSIFHCWRSACNLKSQSVGALRSDAATAEIVELTDHALGAEVETIAGDDAKMAWIDDRNKRDDAFPDDENDVSWDVSDDEGVEDVTPRGTVFVRDD